MKKICSVLLFCFAAPAYAATPNAADATAVAQQYIFNLEYTDAEAAVGTALAQKGFGNIVSASINGRNTTPIFSYNKPIDVEIRSLQANNADKRWSANLLVLSEGNVVTAMPLAGRFTPMVEMPMLKRSIRTGELIQQEDVEIKNIAADRTSKDFVNDMSELVGKTPVRSISPSRPIRAHELSEPAIVKKNATVQMRYKLGSLEITATGQVLADGAKGEAVMVRNLSSKKIVRAIITNENTVDVVAAGDVQPPQQVSQLTGVASYEK